jgi:outer membrane biosynthesis protein TonB
VENRIGHKTKIMDIFKDRDKRKSFIIAILIYGGLAVLFFFIGLKYPDPPLEEGGVEISMADFGFDDRGFGEIEPAQSKPIETIEESTTESVPEVVNSNVEEAVTTQEESDISVPEEELEKDLVVEKTAEEKIEEVKPEETKPVEEPEPEIDEKLKSALGAWDQPEESNNEGTQEGTSGNEGVISGKPEGKGTFGGNGSSFELGGRSMSSGPKVGEKPKEEGKVVLNIWVNRDGDVVRTAQNLGESNTTSQHLFNLAKNAALKARFNQSPDAPPEQRGKMTFIFILR